MLALMACALPILAQQPIGPRETPPAFAPFAQTEVFRIKIVNARDGAIQVSADEGATWKLVGRVTAPATDSLMGYLASGYAKPSTVSATAVHGIRIRVGGLDSAYPKLINILPKEFNTTPKGFGGHVAGASGIYTNIASGTSIFREMAPLAGNTVSLTNEDGALIPLPINYAPRENDAFIIQVKRPANPLREVVIENWSGGAVTATWRNGVKSRVTSVLKPVIGVGRFDGTSYTGVGAINTNHTGVITVSTAPVTTSPLMEGVGSERRGGFQIEPAYHNSQSEEAGAPVILVLGTKAKSRVPDLEGMPPLFFGHIDLAWDPRDAAHSWRVEVKKRRAANTWQPMPQLVGSQPTALRDILAFRLIRADDGDAGWRKNRLADAVKKYQLQERLLAANGKIPVRRGVVSIQPTTRDPKTVYIAYYADGVLKAITNTLPYAMTWDTTDSPDGEYVVEAQLKDATDNTIAIERTRIWVDNAGALRS
jgi:hypothetical protein